MARSHLSALPGISRFLETNVRTYVHVRGRDPGVWFFRLDAAKWLAVQAARWGWHLPSYWARMGLTRDRDRLHYQSQRYFAAARTTCEVTLEVGDWLAEAGARSGTLEYFLAERYRLYARTPRGRMLQGQVDHRPYPLRRVSNVHCQQSLSAAAGIPLPDPPFHAMYSPGVRVQVYGLHDVL